MINNIKHKRYGEEMPKKKKANPYNPEYVMDRDNCSYDDALITIQMLKDKNAWNRGKKLTSRANPYNPEYVMDRDNCSYDEAVTTIKDFKARKATTLDNFVKRYGQEEGTIRYTIWKEKSLGIGHKVAKENGASQSKFSPSYYIRHGCDEETAINMALQFQYENSPLHIDYYLIRGKTIGYARNKIRKIHDKKKGRDSYREFLERQGLSDDEIDQKIKTARGHCSRKVLGDELFERRMNKMRKTFEEKGMWTPLGDLEDYTRYRREVWYYTNLNDLNSLENYDKRGLAGNEGAYHLDHRYSISEGFINNVPADLIGSIKNLEFKPWKENVVKQGSSEITLEELIDES
jgi:hypothetical protein